MCALRQMSSWTPACLSSFVNSRWWHNAPQSLLASPWKETGEKSHPSHAGAWQGQLCEQHCPAWPACSTHGPAAPLPSAAHGRASIWRCNKPVSCCTHHDPRCASSLLAIREICFSQASKLYRNHVYNRFYYLHASIRGISPMKNAVFLHNSAFREAHFEGNLRNM